MNLPPRRVPPAVWVGGGVILGLALVGAYAAPQVVAVTPPPDSVQVPARASLRIEFDRQMDPESTAAHLILEPRLGGRTRWQGTTMTFEPDGPWPEGASIVVQVSAGARSARGVPLLRTTRWTFSIGGPRIVYLWPAGAPANLQAYALQDGSTTPLTAHDGGVSESHLSADGTMVVYATGGESAEIRRLDLSTLGDVRLYACPPQTRCTSPALSPEGDRLAFVQSPVVVGPGDQPVLGPSQVWMLALGGNATPIPIGSSDSVTSMPDWTPHGWLAYYDHTQKAIVVVDPSAGPEPEPFRRFPSEVGERGSWSPDGEYLVFPEIDFVVQDLEQLETEGADLFFSHLLRWTFETSAVADLSRGGAGRVEDASPAYSPDGQWIAFTRKFLDPGRWTLGRQIWLMNADGGDPRQLTYEPEIHHSALAWNADSDALAYMRFNQAEISLPPEIWLYDLGLAEARLVVVGGYLPAWVP